MSYRSWGKKETFKIGNNVYTHDILIVEIMICQGKKKIKELLFEFSDVFVGPAVVLEKPLWLNIK